MRILIICQYFPPEPHRLMGELASTLASFGHEVTVLTGFPHWPAGKLYPGYRMRLYVREETGGITVFRMPLYPDHSASALKRALNLASFVGSACLIAPWVVPRPDVVYVISPPPLVIPAWLFGFVWGVPLTYEVQDMWPEALVGAGMAPGGAVLALVGALAKRAFATAAAIRVISPGFRRDLISRGVPQERIRVISNWVDAEVERSAPEPGAAVPDCPELAGKFVVMFTGNIGLAQGLEVVLDAAELLRDAPNVVFVLAGDGVELPRLERLRRERGIDNVVFIGRRRPEEMPALMSRADVLLVHLRDKPGLRTCIPHKTLSYLASGKPVLAAVRGDTADLILREGAGVTCEPENAADMARAVRLLRSMPACKLARFGQNGRAAARERYSRELLVREVETMLVATARDHPHRRTRRARKKPADARSYSRQVD